MAPAASGTPLRVLMLDPNSHTLPYDQALARALVAAGCQVELALSPFLYDAVRRLDGVRYSECFFSLATSQLARGLGIERRPTVRRLAKAAEYPLDWALLLRRLLLGPPDILHVQWSLSPGFDWRMWRLVQRRGVPIVYTAHNLLPHRASPGDQLRYARLYHTADLVIVHSEPSARALSERFDVPKERVRVAPHGPLLMDEPVLSKADARGTLGLPAHVPLLLFAGLIEPYKGLDDLMAAFQALARDHPTAWLVVAGRPNMPLEHLSGQLRATGLAERVHFDLRFLPQPVLAAYLCAADVVVLPYRTTTASGVLMAARRFGCPVVATSVGDLSAVVQHEVSGLLVPPGEPAALASALGRVLADPAWAARLGAAGRREAVVGQSWMVAAARTCAAYRDVRRRRG